MRRSVYTLFACTFFQLSLNAVAAHNGYTPLKDEPSDRIKSQIFEPSTQKHVLLSSQLKQYPEANANLLRWASGEYPSRVRAALAAGAHVDAVEPNDMLMLTALHKAAMSGSRETIKVLAGARANLDRPAAGGLTAVLLAAQRGETETVRLLIQLGASGDAVDTHGNTALHLIAHTGKDYGETARVLLGLCNTILVDASNGEGLTAAQIAVDNQLLDFLAVLIDQGASVLTSDGAGNTLLHRAAPFKALWPVSTSLRIVELLIKSQVNAAETNQLFQTARDLAQSAFIKKAIEKAELNQGLARRRR